MSPHGQHLLYEARTYRDRLIERGMAADEATKKAAAWFGFPPSTLA